MKHRISRKPLFFAALAVVIVIGLVANNVLTRVTARQIGAAALELANIDMSHMTIQIAPGMKIRNGEGYATVSGFQKCMRADGIELLENDCIVVGKDTQTVQVQVHTREGNTYENSVETWKVVRTPEHPDRMALTRPSGEYVSPAEKDSGL